MDNSPSMNSWRKGLPVDINALGCTEKDMRWFVKSRRAWMVFRKDGSREMPPEYWTDEMLVRVCGETRLFFFALIVRSGSMGRAASLLKSGEWIGETKVYALSPRSAFDYILRYGEMQPEELPELLYTHFSAFGWYQDIVKSPEHNWLYFDEPKHPRNDGLKASTPIKVMEQFAHVGIADAMRKYLEDSNSTYGSANKLP